MAKKNAQPQKKVRNENAKQRRGGGRHKSNLTQSKFWMGMGFRISPKVGLKFARGRADAADPVRVAEDGHAQHTKACARCSGKERLKRLNSETGLVEKFYAPCNRGKAMFKALKKMRAYVPSFQPRTAFASARV